MERDRYPHLATECEQWLRTEVAATYDAMKADPSRGVTLGEVRAGLAQARRERELRPPHAMTILD